MLPAEQNRVARRPTPPSPAPPQLAGPVTLASSYAACQALHRTHGTTYYWATKALPRGRQRHVHALYGLCRFADEIVDRLDGTQPALRAVALEDLNGLLHGGLQQGDSDHLILKAVVHTAGVFDLSPTLFERFFNAMGRDLTQDRYRSYQELLDYMDGSAAVIGEMMLPLLDPVDRVEATPGARALGIAFQLTNFLRDVGEDLDRGRVYFPQDELRRFGVDPFQQMVDERWQAFCRFQIHRIRGLYAEADQGIDLLQGRSAAGIRAARCLYAQILDRIEDNDFDVFSQRARVSLARKLTVAAREVVRTARS